jgi:nitroreductase
MDIAEIDRFLTTTRTVRRGLDLTRPVEREVLQACLEVAVQAPNGGNANRYHFVVVSDPGTRARVAAIYSRAYDEHDRTPGDVSPLALSADYLADHLHEVPILIIVCQEGRLEKADPFRMATRYGSILPATWSLMLALRARGLGSAWTTRHLEHERDMGVPLGIPEDVTQVALLPVAYFAGEDFRAATRVPARQRTYWDHWGRTANA